jgi:hypothetical protein
LTDNVYFHFTPKERSVMKPFRLLLTAVLMISAAVPVVAQTVEFDINLPNYDVVYIADLVDIRTQRLAQNLPQMSVGMRTVPPGSNIQIYLRILVELQLRDGVRTTIVQGQSSPFSLNGSMQLSAADLSGRGAVIRFPGAQWIAEDSPLANQIKDHVANFPTLPVGNLFIGVRAFSASNDQLLGQKIHVISVRNASESEVLVSLISPEHAANVPTTFPTFTWTSQKPDVTLYVYEMLPIHRSPEEAVSGLPYLKRDIRGASTFTYPADAERRLEMGKRYLWFVETRVVTTRGDLTRRSDVRTFRVRPEAGSNALARLLSTLPGDVSGQLSQLIQDGWVPSGVTLDGQAINQGELTALFQRLARENTEVNFRVE